MLKTLFAILIRIFSNSFANGFQKNLVETNSSCFVTFTAYFILSLFCIYPACLTDWTQFGLNFWIYVIIANLLCTLSTVCLVKALKTGELSILSSINSYKCVVALIFAVLWLGEFPNVFGFLGLIFIILGSRFVFDTTEEGFSIAFLKRQDVILRISAMILAGIEAVFLKKIIIMSSFETSFILWCLGGSAFSLIILLISRQKISIKSDINILWKYLILAICLGLMQLSTNYVFSKLEVGLALALFQLSTIINLFIGYKIFREKEVWKKLIGIIIMLIGSTLILLYN